MRIIPVMDLKNGQVVHAVAGERKSYAPVQSQIAASSSPLEVAEAFREEFGFEDLYIADLDAIEQRGSNQGYVTQLRSQGWRIYIDTGISTVADLDDVLRGVDRLVVGTETLRSLDDLGEICQAHPFVVASLDMKFGRVWSRSPQICRMEMEDLVSSLCAEGVSELIFLEVSRVGTESGVNERNLTRALRASTVPLLVGGGIRDSRDIERLSEAGVDGVLVATALHSGCLAKEDVQRFTQSP